MTKDETLADIDRQIAETKSQLADVHGTECEVYARIVGYYRAIKNWNKGKKDEYKIRAVFDGSVKKSRLKDEVLGVKKEAA